MISGFRNLYDKEPMEMTVARFVDWIRIPGTNGLVLSVLMEVMVINYRHLVKSMIKNS